MAGDFDIDAANLMDHEKPWSLAAENVQELAEAAIAFRDAFMAPGDAHSPEQWAAAERLSDALLLAGADPKAGKQ
jgi:hypothetical protein